MKTEIAPGPVAHWTFDELSPDRTEVSDAAGHGRGSHSRAGPRTRGCPRASGYGGVEQPYPAGYDRFRGPSEPAGRCPVGLA